MTGGPDRVLSRDGVGAQAQFPGKRNFGQFVVENEKERSCPPIESLSDTNTTESRGPRTFLDDAKRCQAIGEP